jgi:hypothetical protein
MLKKIFANFTLLLVLLFAFSWRNSVADVPEGNLDGQSGTFEKLVVTKGSVAINLDLDRLNGKGSEASEAKRETLRFDVSPNSFFTIRVLNDVLRGPEPGSLPLLGQNAAILPEPLNSSAGQLVLEQIASTEPHDLVVRDGKTGFVFFNVEGHVYQYEGATRSLKIEGGRLMMSPDFAAKVGRPADAGAKVGEISINANVFPIQVTTLVNGAARSTSLPAGSDPAGGLVPGPDIITGDLAQLQQVSGSTVGTQVALTCAPTSCNKGDVPINFFALPNTDHPVIMQSLYRVSGGASNTERFEQIGEGWAKHAFGADQFEVCSANCQPYPDQTRLGQNCSDTYSASTGALFTQLGSRAWINPFTGAFPSTSTSPNNHTGHTHNGVAHRLTVEMADLNTTLNAGATYYAEVQYVAPHEYTWCQSHPGQCNMYNNATYRRFNVSGTTSFTFNTTGAGGAVRTSPAINAWPGATVVPVEPEAGVDGRAFIAYKISGPTSGVWHYEYVIYNQNLDRAVQSLSIPLGCQASVSNIGFRAPQHSPGFANDGTVGNTGYSNTPWTPVQTASDVTWSTQTFAENQNANAVRWSTSYTFRFDSNQPPQPANATIGFFKTGAPMTVAIQAPAPDAICGGGTPTPTPAPTATPVPTGTPSPGGTATPTPNPTATATPGPGASQALNLSTRLRVQTGDSVGIAGFIITGTSPRSVLIRGMGPSLTGAGVPNALADPVLELHGPSGFTTMVNDNWRDSSCFSFGDIGLAPSNDLESTICATLAPGAYTAIVSGKNNTSGVALVEVYDTSGAGGSSKLANISTRGFVSTGADIVIAGFQLGGGVGNDRIVARGIGPSLTGVGVPNALANPMLELRDNNGTVLASNNNWQDDSIQAAELTAAGLAPANQLESGIAATLPPGPYTALLSGVNNGTGLGLVEIYDRGAP